MNTEKTELARMPVPYAVPKLSATTESPRIASYDISNCSPASFVTLYG